VHATVCYNKNTQKYDLLLSGVVVSSSKHPDYWEYHQRRGDLPKKIAALGIKEYILDARIEASHQWVKLRGRLRYEPPRPGFKKVNKQRTLVLELPRDGLTTMYRWLIKRRYFLNLQPPMWGNHITIVGGLEHIPDLSAWKKHEGELIDFELSPDVYKHWKFWVMPAHSPRFAELRAELGLKPWDEFHLTIGREYVFGEH